jgi:hypothetical protein
MPGDHVVGLEYQEGMGWMRKPESGGGPARKAFGQAPTEQERCRKRWWSWPATPPVIENKSQQNEDIPFGNPRRGLERFKECKGM